MTSDPGGRPAWNPSEGRPPLCGQTHHRQAGWVDEKARRLSHEELAVGRQLAAEGHQVRALSERPIQGPTADLEVCGSAVEIKSFLRLPERSGRPPSSRSVFNKLVQAERQASTVIIYARGSGLTSSAAGDGVAAYSERTRRGRIQAIRMVGDGFDLAWTRQLGLDRRPDPLPPNGRQRGRGRDCGPPRGRSDPGPHLRW